MTQLSMDDYRILHASMSRFVDPDLEKECHNLAIQPMEDHFQHSLGEIERERAIEISTSIVSIIKEDTEMTRDRTYMENMTAREIIEEDIRFEKHLASMLNDTIANIRYLLMEGNLKEPDEGRLSSILPILENEHVRTIRYVEGMEHAFQYMKHDAPSSPREVSHEKKSQTYEPSPSGFRDINYKSFDVGDTLVHVSFRDFYGSVADIPGSTSILKLSPEGYTLSPVHTSDNISMTASSLELAKVARQPGGRYMLRLVKKGEKK